MGKLNGLIAAGFTPLENGKVNVKVIPAYAQFLARNGVTGVFVNGTTGESMSLTEAERITIADAWLEAAPAELKVVVHVGHNSLPVCCALAAHAQEKGAWAVSAMAPTFFKPGLDELIDYAAQIAAAAPKLPFYYYHMPSMTGASFRMTDFLERAGSKISNLAGIKYTWEDLMDFGLCLDFAGGKYDMVFGRDEILLAGLTLGAKAAIGSTYNFAAPLYNAIRTALADGDLQKANELQRISMRLVDDCIRISGGNPLPAIKALTGWRAGIELGPMRAPVKPLSAEGAQQLFQKLEKTVGAYLSK